jgi:hypothetical protein
MLEAAFSNLLQNQYLKNLSTTWQKNKIRNLQRTYRKYLFNLLDLQNKLNILWHSPFQPSHKHGEVSNQAWSFRDFLSYRYLTQPVLSHRSPYSDLPNEAFLPNLSFRDLNVHAILDTAAISLFGPPTQVITNKLSTWSSPRFRNNSFLIWLLTYDFLNMASHNNLPTLSFPPSVSHKRLSVQLFTQGFPNNASYASHIHLSFQTWITQKSYHVTVSYDFPNKPSRTSISIFSRWISMSTLCSFLSAALL